MMNSIEIAATSYKTLTHKEVDHFIRDGFLLVRGAFPREISEKIIEMIWKEVRIDPKDRSTWAKPRHTLCKTFINDTTRQLHTTRVHHALDDLLGEGRYHLDEQLGYALINLPGFESQPWKGTNWHVDGIHFHHHVDSQEQGLVALFLFTDIPPEGGGTAIRPGSHRIVADILQKAEPDGLSVQDLMTRTAAQVEQLPVFEVIGNAGDMVLMHPFAYHGSSTNCSDRIRVASNICIPLHEKMNLERSTSGDYSPVERAIVVALSGDKIVP